MHADSELNPSQHLLARLPLHVQVPPGREEESAVRGLEHARAAEHIYQRLGQQRELTRVWETMGRLALQQGHLQVAQERLMAARNLQQQLGDVAGLARSTAAVVDLSRCVVLEHVEQGEPGLMLRCSIALPWSKTHASSQRA